MRYKKLFMLITLIVSAVLVFTKTKYILTILTYKSRYIHTTFTTYPNTKLWQWCLGIASIYTLVAFIIGIITDFLRFHVIIGSWRKFIIVPIFLLLQPSLIEELIFRVILLPHPQEKNSPLQIIAKSFVSLALFVVYHPFIGIVVVPQTRPLFTSGLFLLQTVFLGLTCTLVYLISGSIWPPVLIHWLAVTVWILYFGGAKNIARAKWFQSM